MLLKLTPEQLKEWCDVAEIQWPVSREGQLFKFPELSDDFTFSEKPPKLKKRFNNIWLSLEN